MSLRIVAGRDVAPRFRHAPEGPSAAEDVVGLAASVGLELDAAQRLVLEGALVERRDGSWAASQVGLVQPRQNGKTLLLAAVTLGALFLFREPVVMWTAHRFSTAIEAWRLMRSLVTNFDHLSRRLQGVRRTTWGGGEIELVDGCRVIFQSRSAGASGRGFSVDRLLLDEAFDLSDDDLAALLPALSARPNHQVWYASSAPKPHSEVLRRICLAGRRGAPGIAYYEWCNPEDAASGDRAAWAAANPAFPARITEETIVGELATLSDVDFRRERLGIWYESESLRWLLIPEEAWSAAEADPARPASRLRDPVALGVWVASDRSWSAIAAAGRRADGRRGIEITRDSEADKQDYRPGTGWLVDRLGALDGRHQLAVIVIGDKAIADQAESAGLAVVRAHPADQAAAAATLFDGLCGDRPDVRHSGQRELGTAAAAAQRRRSGAAWFWISEGADIAPLWACSLALWGLGVTRVHRPRRGAAVALVDTGPAPAGSTEPAVDANTARIREQIERDMVGSR